MHLWIGDLGHLSVVVAFITALVATYGYIKAGSEQNGAQQSWYRFANVAFGIHSLAVLSIIVSLFYIIYNHYFEYHYAWSHSSRHLPTHYMISCFWEGQEGSFLLWIFWHVLLGWMVIGLHKGKSVQAMAVFALVQAFLTSMILGVVLPYLQIKIGSSPFILLRDAMPDAPVFKINPEYIPEDGKGLNPLLQNYWMVIHPPTLFLGFALTLVPFSFVVASLWQGHYQAWLKPSMPWALIGAAVLGVGIMMGAYWAYETLNFGGYWNWDPVENAVYIPWLVLVAGIHTMSVALARKKMYLTAAALIMATFILVLYATFLTRSGILGNASVHSFTDLGLSAQLLIYLYTFIALSVGLLWWRRKIFPAAAEDANVHSATSWIAGGVILLLLAAFQVFVSTSIPVFNAIAKAFGIESNMAPPADPVAHYSLWQLVFASFITATSAIGQFLWWGRVSAKKGWKAVLNNLFLSLVASTLIIVVGGIQDITYILLLVSSVFAIIANADILIYLIKHNAKLMGGSLAHYGLGLMLVGILFSAGYSQVLSINRSGLIYRKDFSEEMNRDNVLLWYNTTLDMGPYKLKYKGVRQEVDGVPGYVRASQLVPLEDDPYQAVVLSNIDVNGKTYFKKGDTVSISPENTYYEIEFLDSDNKSFTLYPRAQVNPNMGLIASPDLYHTLLYDLYVHVSSIPSPDEEKKWSEPEEHALVPGDTFFVHDMVAVFESVQRPEPTTLPAITEADAALQANIRILDKEDSYVASPIFMIRGNMVGRIPAEVEGVGIKLTLQNIDPVKQQFIIQAQTTQKNWVILKVSKKPLINLLWAGSILITAGFIVAARRRFHEKHIKETKTPTHTETTEQNNQVTTTLNA